MKAETNVDRNLLKNLRIESRVVTSGIFLRYSFPTNSAFQNSSWLVAIIGILDYSRSKSDDHVYHGDDQE